MPFASIELRFSIHPKMHAQLTKTPNIRSLFPMYALKHAYPLEWHLRGSGIWLQQLPVIPGQVIALIQIGKPLIPPAMIGSLMLEGETGLNGILRSQGCQIVSWGVFIHPQGKGTQSHRNISRLLNVA